MSFFRAHPLSATVLRLGDVEALQQSDFNPSLPTKFFAHGWTSGAGAAYNTRNGKTKIIYPTGELYFRLKIIS